MVGRINEIFASIQGEGIYFGEKQVFVRFADCNLNCSYCDTDFRNFEVYDTQGLFREVSSFGRSFHSVSFTGGEPLLQKDFLRESLELVKDAGYRTYLETNGTLPEALEEVIDAVDIIAMDIKLPSSGNTSDAYWDEHRNFLGIASKKNVFIKAIISSLTVKEDFMVMLDLLQEAHYCGVLVLQPNSLEDIDRTAEKAAQLKKLAEPYPFPICVIPQMHKIIGVR